MHTCTDQSRAERYGYTIQSRNLRHDTSEPSQRCTPIDETTASESEYIKNPQLSTIPEKDPPTYNDVVSCSPHVRSPAKTSLQRQSTTLSRGSEIIKELRTQPNDSNSEVDLIITDSKQKHKVRIRCSMK